MIGWYPGHMVKAQKDIEKYLPLIDFAIEIVDARAPISTINPLFDKLLHGVERFLLMTKADMADDNETLYFQEHFKKQGKKVLVSNLKDNSDWSRILKFIRSRLGLDAKRGLVVGVPNVGKSTFINRWIGRKSAAMADRVGVTKQAQWYKNKEIGVELLDTAGISTPRFKEEKTAFHMALIGSLRLDVIPHDEIVRYFIGFMLKHYPDNLKERYASNLNDYLSILEDVAKRFSKIRQGEVVYELVYEQILNDFRRGLLGKITLDKVEVKP